MQITDCTHDDNLMAQKLKKMNVILIVTDQERRFKDLPHDFPFDTELPNRKRLINMGTNFVNAFCASNPCTPNRGVLYTGQHFQHTGIYQNWSEIRADTPTIASVASENGYHCVYKGKWHLTSKFSADPRGIQVAKLINPDADSEKAEGDPETWLKQWGFNEWNKDGDRWGAAQEGHKFDQVYLHDSIQWLENNMRNRFMLCINFIQPHDIMYFDAGGSQNETRIDSPFTSYTDKPFMPEPDTDIYNKRFNLLPTTLHSHNKHPLPKPAQYYQKICNNIYGKMTTDDEYSRNLDYYLNCLRENDMMLGKLLDCIDEHYYLHNTVLIFTSDHGEMAGEHGLRQKGSIVYKENIGIPLVFAGCGIPAGVTTDTVISTIDIAPTIMGFMGITGNKHKFIGKDFSRFIMNRCIDKEPRHAALFQYGMGIPHRIRPFSQAVITKRYSFSRHFTTDDNKKYQIPKNMDDLMMNHYVTLYDRQSDPDELVNLADDLKNHEQLIRLLNGILNELIERETHMMPFFCITE